MLIAIAMMQARIRDLEDLAKRVRTWLELKEKQGDTELEQEALDDAADSAFEHMIQHPDVRPKEDA